jgi:glycosyltransferase involved in cell wall biosynthesis
MEIMLESILILLVKKKFGFTSEQTVFLFLGQIRKYKGIDDLIIAFNRVQQKFPHTHLIIAGKPMDQINIEELDIEPGAKSKITLVERYIPDHELQLFFNATDITVLPYKNILTSGSLLNAMSFSCPVIAPRVGMTEEIIQDGYNGFVYELNDVESLTKAMLKLATLNESSRKSLFNQSLESIKKLTWDQTSLQLFSNK